MEVYYNNKIVNNNEFLKPSETQTKPQIKYSFENNKLYTLLMRDPDSVYGNRFHWIVANIYGDVKNGVDLLSYTGPAPPPKTGIHRYIFELYEQDININVNLEERNVPMDIVKNKLNIGEPIYVIHFISKNESGGKRTSTRRNKTRRNKTRRNKNRLRRNRQNRTKRQRH
jgi:phosphatidylethanolamine-binding protein (PEBP) family uncharacterized protein